MTCQKIEIAKCEIEYRLWVYFDVKKCQIFAIVSEREGGRGGREGERGGREGGRERREGDREEGKGGREGKEGERETEGG